MPWGGIGQPGQRETTSTNIETQWKLVVFQTLTAAVFADLILFGLMLFVFIPWAVNTYSRYNWGWWLWFRDSWEWVLIAYLVPWFLFLLLGIWRFCAEVADPSYPTPRGTVPETAASIKPTWPWTPDLVDDDAPPEVRHVHEFRGQLETPHGLQLMSIETEQPDEMLRFARAVLKGDANFSATAAADYGLDGEYERLLQRLESLNAVYNVGSRKTPRLRASGRWFLEQMVSTPLPRQAGTIWNRILGDR